jgi:hypothetical protein
LDKLDIHSEVHWSAEVVIWDQFFSIRVNTFLVAAAFVKIRSSRKASLPDRVFGFFVNLNWMAEVLSEQWNSWSSWLGIITLSVSPSATVFTGSSCFSRNTFLDKLNISGEVHWGAEVVIWDQFFTFRPVATSSNRALLSVVLLNTEFPFSCWSILGYLSWMAEVLREDWSWSSWLGWFVDISLTMSPLATLVASGGRFRGNTSLDELDIVGKIHWGAEVMIWDQFFTVRPVATFSDGAVSGIIGSNTRGPHGILGVFTNINWVAELS